MFCRNCGTENEEGAKFCKSCGSPLETSVDTTFVKQTENNNASQDRSMYKYNYNSGDSDATVSMIMGIISIVMCSSSIIAIGLGIAAIVMANKAKKQGSQSGNITAGNICGIIGICLGVICTLYYLLAFVFGIIAAISY